MGAEFSLYLRKKANKEEKVDNSNNILLFYFGSENAYYLYNHDTGIEDTCNGIRNDESPYKVFTRTHYDKIMISLDYSTKLKEDMVKNLEKELEAMTQLLSKAANECVYDKIKDDIFDIKQELNYNKECIDYFSYMLQHFEFAREVLDNNEEDYELVYMWGN